MMRSLLATVLFLDSSHLLAPIALAWSQVGFRRGVVLTNKTKFIVIPILSFSLAVLTVPVTITYWPGFHPLIGTKIRAAADRNFINPFTVMLTIFVIWNLYHFGSQNFGLWRMWRRGRGRRAIQKIGWVVGTMGGMVGIPIAVPVMAPWSAWLFGLWHWIPAIGLAAKASKRPIVFWITMAGAGAVISTSLWVGVAYGTLAIAMLIVSARTGLGFVHFLYDRWIWRFSDPRVRTTIGERLFA